MMTVIFDNKITFFANTVQEGLRNFNENLEVVLILQSTSKEKFDLIELQDKIMEGIAKVEIKDNKEIVDTLTDYKKVISINKSYVGNNLYFYDIQLGK